jgi:hypothetical protein
MSNWYAMASAYPLPMTRERLMRVLAFISGAHVFRGRLLAVQNYVHQIKTQLGYGPSVYSVAHLVRLVRCCFILAAF